MCIRGWPLPASEVRYPLVPEVSALPVIETPAFSAFFALFRGYSNRAMVSSYDVVENQRRQAAVPAELSRTIVLGRGGSVSLGGFCRQLKQTVLPMRS